MNIQPLSIGSVAMAANICEKAPSDHSIDKARKWLGTEYNRVKALSRRFKVSREMAAHIIASFGYTTDPEDFAMMESIAQRLGKGKNPEQFRKWGRAHISNIIWWLKEEKEDRQMGDYPQDLMRSVESSLAWTIVSYPYTMDKFPTFESIVKLACPKTPSDPYQNHNMWERHDALEAVRAASDSMAVHTAVLAIAIEMEYHENQA